MVGVSNGQRIYTFKTHLDLGFETSRIPPCELRAVLAKQWSKKGMIDGCIIAQAFRVSLLRLCALATFASIVSWVLLNKEHHNNVSQIEHTHVAVVECYFVNMQKVRTVVIKPTLRPRAPSRARIESQSSRNVDTIVIKPQSKVLIIKHVYTHTQYHHLTPWIPSTLLCPSCPVLVSLTVSHSSRYVLTW